MTKWIIILLIAAGAAFYGFKKWSPAASSSALAEADARPKTAVAEQRDIRFSVPAAGEISPAEQVSVKPEINGRIQELPVDIGDFVKKNQVLFTLDDNELQNERLSRLTEIERASLQVAQAERNFKRASELFEANLIAKELFENAKTDFDLAKNTLERSRRDLAIVEERLTKTKIVAPFDSTILTRPVSVGQAVSGSGGFNSGTEVLTIADLNNLIINAHINQADIIRLRPEQIVEVAVEAVPGLTVNGRVERIAPQATIRNNIKGFAVRILLKDVDKRIRPGMTANIKIPVASAENVVAVPLAAVFTERDPVGMKTERFVYVKNGDSYEHRPVTVGVADFFFAEIQKGVAPGEIVSLEPPKQEVERLSRLARQNQPPPGAAPARSGSSAPAAPAKAPPAKSAVKTSAST